MHGSFNHYLTSYLLAIAIKYTYVGAGNLLHVCTLKRGWAVLPVSQRYVCN